MSQHKNPCPGGHDIYNFGRPFFCHHYYTLSLSDLCGGVEKKVLKKIMHFHYIWLIWQYIIFTLFTPKFPLFGVGWGSWHLQFLVSLTYRCYMLNLVKIGPVVICQKMLTDDGRNTTHDARRTTHVDRHKPIAIGNLSDSGDLNNLW